LAHGELLQIKMPPVKVEALLTVGKNCVTCAHQGTCWGVFLGCWFCTVHWILQVILWVEVRWN